MTKKSKSTRTKRPLPDHKEMLLALYALLRGLRWDPLPKLAPVTPDGRARIAWVEEHGSMAGFNENR